MVDGDEAHHAIKVLRVEINEEIMLADGSGAWVRGSVASIDKKSFVVSVLERGLAQGVQPELIIIQPRHHG